MQFTMENTKENPRFVTMPQVHPAQVDCLCDVPGSFRMKEIKLSQGKVAIVDDEDYDYLMQWKWNAQIGGRTFYAVRRQKVHEITEKVKTILMHRIILNTPSSLFVDHINHNGLDNRKQNIRNVTPSENSLNKSIMRKRNAIGAYKNRGNRFLAQIVINGKHIHLGMFDSLEDGHRAYLTALKLLKP